MSDQTRRQAFVAYFKRELRGDRAAFLQKSGYTKGRLTQLLDADEPFGEVAAINVAVSLGLRKDAFLGQAPRAGDQLARNLDEAERELLRLWEPLLDDQREAIMAQLRKEHEYALKVAQEIRRRGLDHPVGNERIPAVYQRPAQRALPIDDIEKPKGKK